MESEGSYICATCGEEIVLPVDPTEGMSQVYVEDCPVCCRPQIVHVEYDEEGTLQLWSENE